MHCHDKDQELTPARPMPGNEPRPARPGRWVPRIAIVTSGGIDHVICDAGRRRRTMVSRAETSCLDRIGAGNGLRD